MKTYPLHSVSLEEAKQLQFRVVDAVTRHFDGRAVLSLGDLGVSEGLNRPVATHKAEQVIAEVFGAEDATLVRGAGTGAIRWGLTSFMHNGGKLLVHKAPIYPTTKVTIETMNLRPVEADYNTPGEIARVLRGNPDIGGALVQVTRQKPDDRYDLGAVIGEIHAACPALPVLTDDNYAVMKIPQIGVQCGASLSSFSSFKLLGPEGVGVLAGSHELIERVRAWNYSGGSQVQGHEAMAVLRGLIYAPVALAIESEVADELPVCRRGGGREGRLFGQRPEQGAPGRVRRGDRSAGAEGRRRLRRGATPGGLGVKIRVRADVLPPLGHLPPAGPRARAADDPDQSHAGRGGYRDPHPFSGNQRSERGLKRRVFNTNHPAQSRPC